MPRHVQVLISGGGPVGLAAAVELGLRGIDCLVVEPRSEVSRARPRCKTLNVRTMEHLRRWGLAGQIRERAPLATSWSQDVVFCTSLSGWELSRFSGVFGLRADGERFPELGQQAPQYVLEQVLREAVAALDPGELLLGARVVAVTQDEKRASVTVEHGSGECEDITADYVIGCDGPRSVVRDQIGSAYRGGQALRPNFGMVFESPELWRHVKHGPAVQYWIVNGQAPALMGPLDRAGSWWAIAFGVDEHTGQRDARGLIDGFAGVPVEARVRSTDPWTARMQITDRMRDGRVFLAGDAAHLNPPFGGHGLNTGIGDAVDLGWKIAAVLHGWGGPALLDSYEAERRPVQERVIAEATANMRVLSTELLADNLDDAGAAGETARRAAGRRIQQTKRSEFHSLDLVLGLRVADSPILPPSEHPLPGTLLPHRFLPDGRSLYDLLGPDLTLLVDVRAAEAAAAVQAAARTAAVPLARVDLPGLDGPGLLIVRPDRFVAWQGAEVADADLLLNQLTGNVVVADRPHVR
jgi:2-polyprenyl-6-methoxyphenol hydroxylase-like FAD-dependent oxidoreductase